MVTKTEAIKNFLKVKARPELADLYGPNMEVQVNVAQGEGDPITGEFNGHKWQGWTDGSQTWKQIRIPYNAKVKPEYADGKINFDLAVHAEGIGMTGWDWLNKKSLWVGFDFDAIAGHSEAHSAKLTDEQLNEVRKAACEIPWVTVRQSTSGNGLHLYVFLEGVDDIQNHNEHSAIARAILSKMSGLTGCDFNAKVDNCGSVLWIWHSKFDRVGGLNGPGLKLIKKGEPLRDIPSNWRDHIKVTSGKKRRTIPGFVNEDGEDDFVELCGERPKIPLDAEHKRLKDWVEINGNKDAWWDADSHMFVCHTIDLQEAHTALGLRGIFKTKSSGSSGQNCFCFPMRKGVWSVRRHSPGVQEDESWDQDGAGWTRCYLNQEPDLKIASRINGGSENDKGAFVFRETEMAIETAKSLGAYVDLPNYMMGRQAHLRPHKDGKRLIFEIKKSDTDSPEKMQGWTEARGGLWQKILNVNLKPQAEPEVGNYEDIIRHLVTDTGGDAGWVLKSDGTWFDEPIEHIKHVLHTFGLGASEIKSVLGASVLRKWTLINEPFHTEYPGDRQWNKDGAQFAFAPSNEETLNYPDWTRVLNRSAQGLDMVVKKDPWCIANGIATGGDYLKLWISWMFQNPFEQLPYLFFYGPENCGKSIVHEAIQLLVTKGVAPADSAITDERGFNGELAGAILCVVEETDLRKNKQAALNRIKSWVTAKMAPIHAKNGTPYTIRNSWHWLQTANSVDYCPIWPGDTRIVVCYVSAFSGNDEIIQKTELLKRLQKQAPDFLAAILNCDLPPAHGRLNIPVLATADKLQAQQGNQTELEQFLSENTHPIPGQKIKLSELYDRYVEWLPPNLVGEWTNIRFGREVVKLGYVKGRSMKDGAQFYIGNISFVADAPGGQRLVLEGEKLV